MALKLGAALGTSPGFWLNAQTAVDLFEAAGRLKTLPDELSAEP
jgi:plasmid maintenance system antidote protein VapI